MAAIQSRPAADGRPNGTTHKAAKAGRLQVIITHNYDQFYWAHRVDRLRVGVSGHLRDELAVEALTNALNDCLQPEVTRRAHALAGRMELQGARIASNA